VGAGCSAHCPVGQITQAYGYVYDRYPNLWQKNVTAGSGPGLSVTFSTGNNNPIDGYSHDANGNLLNDGTHSYTYDAEGRRVQKTTASGTVNYVYGIAGQQVAEVNSSGTLNRAEVYAGGWHLATYTNSTTYFNHTDWLGTERMRTGVSGMSCESIVSLPFGEGEATSGSWRVARAVKVSFVNQRKSKV
jgi:YD repeat-containing protein